MIWYCLPDSHCCILITRDLVPGYSRFARYCLPDRQVTMIFDYWGRAIKPSPSLHRETFLWLRAVRLSQLDGK